MGEINKPVPLPLSADLGVWVKEKSWERAAGVEDPSLSESKEVQRSQGGVARDEQK